MKKLLSAAGGRLRQQKGESIGEVLVSLLISAVALVMLASMINTSARLVSESREKMGEYYQANEALTKQQTIGEETDYAVETKTGAVIKLSYLDAGAQTTVSISTNVKYQVNPLDDKVVSYWE